MEWISVKEKLPEYGINVLVCRPNPFSGKKDIIIGRLYPAEPDGRKYGAGDGLGNYPMTFNVYWALPAIVLFETITHWQPLPEPPKD